MARGAQVVAGAYRSKQRDAAISNLIKLAASEEFRQRVRRASRSLLVALRPVPKLDAAPTCGPAIARRGVGRSGCCGGACPSALQATEPVTQETTFQIWTRVGLRTVQDSYPVFNKASLRACMAAHARNSMTTNSMTKTPSLGEQLRRAAALAPLRPARPLHQMCLALPLVCWWLQRGERKDPCRRSSPRATPDHGTRSALPRTRSSAAREPLACAPCAAILLTCEQLRRDACARRTLSSFL